MSLFNFFKPKWQHSDPTIRLQAAQEIGDGDQQLVKEILKTETNAEVRRVMVRKATDIELLRQLAQDEDSQIKQEARTRLQDKAAALIKSMIEEIPSESEWLLKEIAQSKHLDDLLRNAPSVTVRKELVRLCPRQSVLVTVAQKDPDESVALVALSKINRENLITEVQQHSRHPTLRQAASEMLRSSKAQASQGAVDTVLLRKRDVLRAQIQRVTSAKIACEVESQLAPLLAESEKLGMGPMQVEIEHMAQEFLARCQAERDAIAEERRQVTLASERNESLRRAMHDLEAAVNEGHAHAHEAKVRDLQQLWNTLEGNTLPDLDRRFQNSVQRFQRQLETEMEHRLDETQQKQLRTEILDQLNLLLDKDELDSVERQLRGLVRSWESLPLLEGEDQDLQTYNRLRDQISQNLQSRTEHRREAYESKLAQLNAVIERVKSIDENQDFREIAKVLRQTYLDWKDVVGEDKFQFQEIWKEYRAATARFQEMQQWESWHNERDREAVIDELTKLVEQEPGMDMLHKLRQIQQQWKTIGPVAQPRLQELWDKFRALTTQIMEKCHDIVEEQNQSRQQNLELKNSLCEQVEALAADQSDNWKDKSKAMQSIQEAWKKAGPVPRENNQPLWDRFRAACDIFYANHKVFLRKEDGERQENLQIKISLCEQAEALRESTDWTATTNRLKRLQDEWKNSGPVPKSDSEAIWARFRDACDAFFDRKRKYFEELDSAKQDNYTKKIALCERLEAMVLDPSNPEVVQQVDAIESEWKSIGMVPKDVVDALWDRFCLATDKFLDARAATDTSLRQELDMRLQAKQAMIGRVQELCDDAGNNQSAEAVRVLQEEWKRLGRCGEREQELYHSFRDVCDEFFVRRRDQMEIQEQARQNNLQKKLLLVDEAEHLLTNGTSSYEAMNEVKHLRRLWKEIGAVPREQSDRIWKRFNGACDAVFAAARSNEGPQDQGASSSVEANQ